MQNRLPCMKSSIGIFSFIRRICSIMIVAVTGAHDKSAPA
ncbi:hypothetical protein HMPREF9554_01218 [Treponema phagedenis F0421]|nr:hypothetical protein HMPREF9554_01218 [Treponema phagedenis F0421]